MAGFLSGAKSKNAEEQASNSLHRYDLAAVDSSAVAMMMVDRDFRIVRVNAATERLLRENEAAFQRLWPQFRADKMIGTCIDMFHKNPGHQRQLLSDPSRLPYRTEITVGDKTFSLSVGAVRSAAGDYIGNTLEWADVSEARINEGRLKALTVSTAVIEFKVDGTILNANQAFLDAVGYTLEEIRGKHHSMFCDPAFVHSPDYSAMWSKLSRGEFIGGKFRRLSRSGKDVWLQATYTPILDRNGKAFAVVKFATDVTATETTANEAAAKLAAIARTQAVIEFTMDGVILDANDNFLSAMGYQLSEIKGKRHAMFVEPAFAQGNEYREFWARLNRGECVAAAFHRIGKNGRDVWIQASYTPILDFNGKPYKVVKFATDITQIELDRQAVEKERAEKAAAQDFVVQSLANGLAYLAEGDLRPRLESEFPTDYERLRQNFNATADQLEDALSVISRNASAITASASEVAQASEDLARRTEQQAATLEETAAALDEITATVKKTAQGSARANDVVNVAKSDAHTSGEVVLNAVSAMSEIEKSSSQIAQIIGVIDEISFQTNLLALNAGVEAARAGDAGRGFAVVASEVRSLAQRTSEAAKEIKGLISTSTQQVSVGVKLVDNAGTALQKIVAGVTEISALVAEMSASAQEQATALSEVNTAINQMDQVTQQNAAMVEESNAASHSLNRDAQELSRLVSRFSTRQSAQDGAAPAARRKEPVAAAQKRIAAFAARTKGSGANAAAAALKDDDWESF